ncbi:calmodulin-beta [Eurytemora carolleeae]|uniref:calmodulin-beta n=1 Tax=Eurytemora carolleeae TaxID=1294199 RepID=UPI000C79052F|nr:calmodulin-beta [Eurytemora carolleeae]XP_023332652.1 calmodulin-beta [Eurytemora carolleeae]|eukprot:XP_023332651.1 calmodulin-beta-like [Eurytemora affinis]
MSWFLMNRKGEERKKKEEIKKQFMKAIGKDASDGKLSRDQWTNVLIAAGIHNSTEEVHKSFETRVLENGRLSFEEFMGEESRAERLFKLMDKDGDGFVTKTEFREVCKNLNREQIDLAFKKFDQTGNDKLNFREFCDMMNKRTNSTKKGSETATANPSNSSSHHAPAQ